MKRKMRLVRGASYNILQPRANKILPDNVDELASLVLDIYYLHATRETTKSDFLMTVCTLFWGGWVNSTTSILRHSVEQAFNACVKCGALKYEPRKPLLPGY